MRCPCVPVPAAICIHTKLCSIIELDHLYCMKLLFAFNLTLVSARDLIRCRACLGTWMLERPVVWL